MPNQFILPSNALFVSLSDYMRDNLIDGIEFGPNYQPPWLYANLKKNGQVILRTLISESLQNDRTFYDRVINQNLSENPYRICLNGHGGNHYLTQPAPTLPI